ncbi:MAG: hypothetical protein IJG25_07690, partial [Thermoguttaceae bacterium]|nr:hypothetical protein [Thermoguttaceae bacterium]
MKKAPLFALIAALCAALIPTAATSAQERAVPDKTPDPARTENFRSKRYGVFFHYLNGVQNSAESLNSDGK